MARRRILFLDAYDSFSNNIVSLLTTALDVDVSILPIDTPLLNEHSSSFRDDLARELSQYAAVVCGPGPGSPASEEDVGLMRHIWRLGDDNLLPVLGICLGFQSLVLCAGGRIRRLRRGLHGMVRAIEHRNLESPDAETIFAGVGPFKATLYHSLCADIGQDDVAESDWARKRWEASPDVADIVPLAWTSEEREGGVERILMAARHRLRPFWGLQYHPESVCTDPDSRKVIQNWFREAVAWNIARGRGSAPDDGRSLARQATRPSLLSQLRTRRRHMGPQMPKPWAQGGTRLSDQDLNCTYHRVSLPLARHVSMADIAERLGAGEGEVFLLESSNAGVQAAGGAADVRGRFSILAPGVQSALRLEHQAGSGFAVARIPRPDGSLCPAAEKVPLDGYGSVWELVSEFAARRRLDLSKERPELPFRGGFMGYISYEMGLHGIGVSLPSDRGHDRPDISLSWVTRSIVVDHAERVVHVQMLAPTPEQAAVWIDATVADLEALQTGRAPRRGDLGVRMIRVNNGTQRGVGQETGIDNRMVVVDVKSPEPRVYEDKVRQCQDYIAAGESYELCLTAQTDIYREHYRAAAKTTNGHPTQPLHHAPYAQKKTIRRREQDPTADHRIVSHGNTPSKTSKEQLYASPWALYKALRARQPAPFASYLRVGGATLVSASPERFLGTAADGRCSMRPMKGTVRKSERVATLAAAERILHVPKEEGENLMIVDLVRHDLHAVCGPGNVVVPELLRVEEYASVFQMVTVVEGQLPSAQGSDEDKEEDDERYTGFDVLAASLPPGSMTGAPKKRSCEILRELEGGRERGLYSGVVGYLDVTGRGDWSVTIRSLARWDDEFSSDDNGEKGGPLPETWHVGAGGAVTILSTPRGEREEMLTKLAGPMGVFVDG